MKIAVIIVRTIIGLLYLVSSIGFFFHLMPQPELNDSAKVFMIGMGASGYLFPVVKVIELVCGIALISGRFVSLATVVIFPITLNIFLFNAFLAPEGMLVSLLLLLGNLFLAYYYRKKLRDNDGSEVKSSQHFDDFAKVRELLKQRRSLCQFEILKIKPG